MRKTLGAALLCCGTLAHCNTSENILERCAPAMLRLSFLDKDTGKTSLYSTGFFISDDGVGLTAAPILESMQDSKILVKTYEGKEASAEPIVYEELPAIGLLQVDTKETPKIPLASKVREGDRAFVLGIKDKHVYFNEVFITDTKHHWVRKTGNGFADDYVIRFTGPIPKECIGGPILNEKGKAIGVVFNIELGLGIAMETKKLKEIGKTDEDEWRLAKSWKLVREGIYKKFLDN